jgi:class 3 adenylate cyclase
MDHALKMMEKCTGNYEQAIVDRTRLLNEEMKKSEVLLYRCLPKVLADRLRSGQTVEPEIFESCTILVTDVDQLHTLTTRSTPMQYVLLLNDLQSMMEEIIQEYDVFKVHL